MITPRRTRLLRVPDLRAYRAAIEQLVRHSGGSDTLVVVATRGAAKQLGVPAAVTREELYDQLHARLTDPPRRLTALERRVIAHASARAAAAASSVGFQLRAGLIGEMLRFYDQLRRQSQAVDRFEALIGEALEGDEIDRGARRMRQQTTFLAAAFREYERRVEASGACDEHVLRARLIAERAGRPVRHVVVTTADWIAEPDGLFVADFDLLSRIPALGALDIVATESVLGSGFHERVHGWLPGLDESSVASRQHGVESHQSAGSHQSVDSRESSVRPMLIVPAGAAADELWWTHRDREEELVAVVRQLKADRRRGEQAPLDRIAIVFKPPLPYLYLAPEVFGSARIPYRTFDALPLAAEPTSSSLDLVLEAVATDFTRDALVALLRSPHLRFASTGEEPSRAAVSALDRRLSDARYLGGRSRLPALAEHADGALQAALREAVAVADELGPLAEPAPASRHLRTLLGFWQLHLRPAPSEVEGGVEAASAGASLHERERRARAAIAATLDSLAAVHEAHDDPQWTIDDLGLAVRQAIEEQTFEVDSGQRGVCLLDDKAARYGDFDDITIVGLVEADWPERSRRNIFYPPRVLKSLGWPSERDRQAGAEAQFLDLIASAARRTTLSTFTLDDEALVSRSMLLDEVARARLSTVGGAPATGVRVFMDEALSLGPVVLDPLEPDARQWAAMRASRTPTIDPRFHGSVLPAPVRAWSVSALETYLGCPFRFFAQHVLRLQEEPEDEEIMDPRRQGQFVHEVFERFFDAWGRAGHAAITASNLDEARRIFANVVEDAVGRLSEAEGGLERTRLLGSPAAAGLAEAVMRMEAERATPVVARLLEHPLEGTFTFATDDGPRTIALKGKADRLDLLADGTFRLIDYKLGWPPDRRTALQLPIYSICAEQQLAARAGGPWRLGEAAYIAFKGPRRILPLFKSDDERDEVLASAQRRLVATIDRITAGEFPPTPDDVYRCETCSYAAVCRKDYVGDV